MTGFDAPAEAYDRFVGRYSGALARELMAAAGVAAGQRALDVGCGPGALTSELVTVLGAGNVSAVDPSPGFAAACEARNNGVRVTVAPAESLPFEDEAFDVALAQLVVNFMTDAVAGVREMARVVRADGVVGAATWDYAGGMTLLRAFWDAAAVIDAASQARDEGHAMRYANADELAALWTEAGLADVRTDAAVVSAGYDDFDDLWLPLERGVGPAGAYATSLAADRRAELKEAMRNRLGVDPDAPFELTARAWAVAGIVPTAPPA
jgi:SAM-dependent methyltransferase